MAGRDLYALLLAGLFHDPPWKPWVVVGRAPGVEELEEALRNQLHPEFKNLMEKPDSEHEKHALALPLAIAKALEASKCEEAKSLSELFLEAAKYIAGVAEGSEELKDADRYASAIDRTILYDILYDVGREAGQKNLHRIPYSREVRLVNPFTLQEFKVKESIGLDKLVAFIEEYTRLVVDALETICCSEGGKKESIDCRALAVTAAYLLLESTWYYTTSRIGEVYAPPADTRVPTHTVFDHADTVLSVILLGRRGCLAVVDLAGVQAWIGESRRLRDLWAASWLASLLAWKAVEPLVKRYGPGVLVSPPGRLNPFLASTMLGAWLQKKDEDWLWKAMGLNPSKKWPVDPVMPSRLVIAVPGEACNGLEETVTRGIEEAWRLILEATIDKLAEDCGNTKGCELSGDLVDAAKRLEPPLGVRVLAARFNAGEDKLLEVYHKLLIQIAGEEKEAKISAPGRRTGRAYHEYAERAYKEAMERGKAPELCTICGRGIALYQGRERIFRVSRKTILAEAQGDNLCPYCLVKRTLRYILSETSLSTRLVGLKLDRGRVSWRSVSDHSTRNQALRAMIEDGSLDAVLAEIGALLRKRGTRIIADLIEILGVFDAPAGENAPEKLRATVEKALSGATQEEAGWASRLLWRLLVEASTSPVLLEKRENDLSSEARSIVTDLKRIVGEVVRRVGDKPNRYAFIVSDGDYMGKGLLSGKIPVARIKRDWRASVNDPLVPARAREYFAEGRALARVTISDARIAELVRRAYRLLRERVEEAAEVLHRLSLEIEKGGAECSRDPVAAHPPTLPVTPAYHATVSRSLAVVSALDREAVEEHGGDVVYLGGDDALVVAPPESRREDRCVYPALEIAAALRRHMSGSGSPVGEGFIAVTHEGRILHLAPAPGAYGRSTVVYLGDVKKPMWLALAAARGLEEGKDESRTILASEPEAVLWRKDLLLVASETRGAMALPMSDVALGSAAGEWPFDAVKELLEAVSGRIVSGRILYMAPDTLKLIAKTIELAGEAGKHYLLAAAKLLATEVEDRIEDKETAKRLCKGKGYGEDSGDKDKMPPSLCLLARLTPDGEPAATEDKTLSRVARWLDIAEAVRVDKLVAAGVDYSRNPYITALTHGGETVIPALLGVIGAAYVYSSATSPPEKKEVTRA